MPLVKFIKSHITSLGLIPLFILAHFGHHLLTAIPVPLLPMIRSDFNLDYTKAGLVISAFNICYGISQIPAGWLGDRVGARLITTLGILGVAVAGFFIGISNTYIMLIVFLGLMGLMGGGYHPGSVQVLSSSIEPKKRGRALGLHLIGGSASFFLAPLIAAAVAGIWGWRGAFVTLAIPTAIFGIAFYWLIGKNMNVPSVKVAQTTVKETQKDPGQLRRLVLFMILTNLVHSIFFASISFIPLFLVDHFGMSQGAAAASTSLIYLAGLWASPLGGYISDRLGRLPVVLTVFVLAGPLVYLLNVTPSGIAIGALLVSLGAILYIYPPICQAYIVENTSERHRSTILGIFFFGNNEGGGVVTPVLGFLIDKFSFQGTFTIAGAAIVGITLLFAIALRGVRARKAQAGAGVA